MIEINREQYQALQDKLVLRPRQILEIVVERLVARGLAKYHHADPFRNLRESLFPYNKLFLLVPPLPLGLFEEPERLKEVMVKNLGWGIASFNAAILVDEVWSPPEPYLINRIEDGDDLLGIPAERVRERLERRGRIPYTLWHGILHAAAFEEMVKYDMVCLGSPSQVGERWFPKVCTRARELLCHGEKETSPLAGFPSSSGSIISG